MASSRNEIVVQSIDGLYITGHELRVMNSHHAPSEYGVYEGAYDEMEVSLGSTTNKVSISKGVALTGGLLMTITNQFEIDLPTVAENTRIIVALQGSLASEGLDTDVVILTGTTSEYPTLTQNDLINNESGIYQIELARAVVTSGTLSNLDMTNKKIIGKNLGAKVDGKLSIQNPEVLKGPLTVDSGNTISMLNLKSNSTGDKDITIKSSGDNRVGLIRWKNNSDGYTLLANYYDNPNTPVSSFRFDKTGAYVNNNQLLEVRNAFTQTTADGRYLKLSGGTLTGDLRIDGRLSPIRLTGVDTSAFSPYTSYWTNGNTRLKLTHNNSDDSILLYSYNTAGAPSNGLAITDASIVHKANSKTLAYKNDVMANTGDKNITGSITWTGSSSPMRVVNVTDATLTSVGDVVNLAGKNVGRFMYKGSGTNGEVWAVGYNSSGSSILVGTKATIDGVYDYGSGGILTLNASVIKRDIARIETQIEMQNKIDSQQAQIDLLNAQMQASINGTEVPTTLKTPKVQSDELIKLNEELNKSQEELKAQIELDEKIKSKEA